MSRSSSNDIVNVPRIPRGLRSVTAVWALAVVVCTASLFVYGAKPGQAGSAPSTRPEWLSSRAHADVPTLVLALHPRCPCTTATLANIEQAFHTRAHAIDLVVLMYKPDGSGDDWDNQAGLDGLRERLGARVVADTGGRLAKSLGAFTSGHVIYYDQGGALRFSGGVTPSRGHEGDCAPLEVVKRLLREAPSTTPAQPALAQVFGCPITVEACGPQHADAAGGECAP